MIVKETDNQKNNHARKRIEKDHILPNRLNKINVHVQSHKEIVKREENKRKIKMTFKELKLSKKRFQKIEKTKRTERNKVEKLANHNHMTETLQTQVQQYHHQTMNNPTVRLNQCQCERSQKDNFFIKINLFIFMILFN